MKRRKLSKAEIALWKQVAQSTDPLHPVGAKPAEVPPQEVKPKPKAKPEKAPKEHIAPFELSSKLDAARHDFGPTPRERISQSPLRMDRRTNQRLKRGKLEPEARIDLHGMTLSQAHGALNGFIYRSHGQGKRLVLVITGKGKDRDDGGPIPVRRGVLRQQVPHWLQVPPLSHLILQIEIASLRHGGEGAYYVYLARGR